MLIYVFILNSIYVKSVYQAFICVIFQYDVIWYSIVTPTGNSNISCACSNYLPVWLASYVNLDRAAETPDSVLVIKYTILYAQLIHADSGNFKNLKIVVFGMLLIYTYV